MRTTAGRYTKVLSGTAGIGDRSTPTGHQSDGCNAVTGGASYNPSQSGLPQGYTGDYLFADVCQGFIRRLDPETGRVRGFASGLAAPVDVKVGAGGDLYYLSRGANSVERIRYTG